MNKTLFTFVGIFCFLLLFSGCTARFPNGLQPSSMGYGNIQHIEDDISESNSFSSGEELSLPYPNIYVGEGYKMEIDDTNWKLTEMEREPGDVWVYKGEPEVVFIIYKLYGNPEFFAKSPETLFGHGSEFESIELSGESAFKYAISYIAERQDANYEAEAYFTDDLDSDGYFYALIIEYPQNGRLVEEDISRIVNTFCEIHP